MHSNESQREAGDFEDDEEEMSAAERDLASDAQWKLIQKNTFTRWANEHLKTVNKALADLESDLGDGLRLLALIEVLSGKKFKHVNKRPTFRTQKLENVTMVLEFLERDEGIRIVNIDSSDIVDHKLKLILGLIWTLILHYSISMPMWEGEEPTPSEGGPTPKQRLLNWIQSKIPDLPIKNFTTDWNDGRAIGALVDAVGPGLCPDWEEWDPKKGRQNAQEAMDAADKWLGVPQLIKPDEMTNPKIDEMSMMTYLSQFPNAKLKPNAPLRPKLNSARVRAWGPGLEPTGNHKGAPARFTIETFSAGKGEIEVIVLNPRGIKEACEVVFNNDRNLTYSCCYVPSVEGIYKVIIKFGGREIPKSPYEVSVEGAAGDASKVKAYGPGLERSGNIVNKRTYFEIDTKDAGQGTVDVVILDPHGRKDSVRPSITKKDNFTYTVEYIPLQPGLHSINIFFAGSAIPNSPFGVGISPAVDAKRCYASGRGIQPKGIRVKDEADFKVFCKDAGEGDLGVQVIGPGNTELKCKIKKIDTETYEVVYFPVQQGHYVINVTYGGQHITKSPFKVEVGAYMESRIRAYGPGLEGGIVGQPAVFTVETNGETGALGFSIEGPSQCKIDCKDNGDGSADVTYWPTAPGDYAVHILCNEEDIPKSPYMAEILPASTEFDASKVTASGPGLEKTGVFVNKVAEFTVDTRKGGKAPLKISCLDVDYTPVDVQIQDNRDGTYTCRYTARRNVKHTIIITYGGVNIPKSPFRVYVQEPSRPEKVRVFGPGVERGVKTFIRTYFVVDCKSAGPGDVAIALTDEQGRDVPVETVDNGDGTFNVEYEPQTVGTYQVAVYYADQPVPNTPIKVNVQPSIDLSKVKVEGLEPKVAVGETREVKILTKGAGPPPAPRAIPGCKTQSKATPSPAGPGAPGISATTSSSARPGEAPLLPTAEAKVFITAPSGQTAELPTAKITDGYSTKFALDEPGPYQLNITYGDMEVPQTPFQFEVVSSVDEAITAQQAPKAAAAPVGPGGAANVKAYGPGLKGGQPDKPATFTVDTREAGPGGLGVTVEGPAESVIDYHDNQDGTCDVSYIPPVMGDYTVNITYNDDHIKDSPFVAKITPAGELDVSGVTVSGPGIEPEGVFLSSPTEFTVDARSVTRSGEGTVKAVITNPSGTKNSTNVTNNGDGTYNVAYTPYEEGPHNIDITYENLPIPKTPFKTNVVPGCDPNRVKAYGPGLEGATTNTPAEFTVDIKGAGQGGLGLAIEGPSEAKVTCKDNKDGTCLVEYHPTKPGDYDIAVKFADQHIPGSPFKVKCENPVDADKVKCYGPGLDNKGVLTNQPATFTIDTTEAGNAPLEVTSTDQKGKVRPAEIVPVSEGVYQATYYPEEEGKCKVDVKYGGKPVPHSPFQTRVLPGADASKVRVTGLDDATVPASMPLTFTVDTSEAGNADLDIVVQRPDGSFVRPKCIDNGDGTVTVEFTPDELGVYSIKVKFGGVDVPGSPFDTKAIPTGDASRCRITEGLETPVMVGKETVITVDAAEAGTGKVTCRIRSPSGTDIDIDIVENVDGTFSIMFTPQFPGDYTISIKFGGQPVPQGDYVIQVGEDLISPDSVDNLHGAPGLFHPVGFRIPVGPVFNFVSVYVMPPSGKKCYPKIEDNKDGTVTVHYQPTEMGLHELHILYNQDPIEGSPFQFHVDAVDSGYVTAYGPGLSHGTSGEPAPFTIVTKDAGAGGLSLAIEGPSKAEIDCKDNGDGTCKVSYLPTVPGEYTVIIKFADKHIMGSPFKAKITGDRHKKRSQVSVGSSTEVSLKVTEADIGSLTASIRSPSGREEPCILKKLPNGHLGISFTPREVGEHYVNVYRDEKHIPNSPFKINVGEGEVGNASKVKAYGPGLKDGMANQVNEFTVNTKDAGYGGLSLSIEGPSKADIECNDNGDGSCRVTYKPTEPGTYIINIKFADEHVPGSPYSVRIGGEPTIRLSEKITRHREAADVTRIGSQCELSLKIPGTSQLDMTASVTSPSGVTDMCDIVNLDDNRYSIKFVPQEMGVHTVSVKHKDLHIPGSPFEFTVGPITGGGSHKVHANGPGLERGVVDIKNEFNIYTREAGAGGLSIAVEGPSKAEINFEDRKDGSCGISYAVTEPGDYMVSIKFNDEHIPESPFRVPVSPAVGDAKRLSVRALQEKGLQVGKPAAFTVCFNGAEGNLQARVISPSGAEDEALIQEVDSGEFAVRFIPRENGLHFVHVLLNGCHIPGSPFKILVGRADADAGKVKAYGDGLRTGKTDQVCKFYVNTADAGSGALAVTVEGPSKVKLECKEVEEGYEFTYTPTAPGDYYIKIRYAGVNIVGSPFKAVIEGPGRSSGLHEQSSVIVETVTKTSTMTKFKGIQKFDSDASKVIASGNGLTKTYRGKTSAFQLETMGAGNNILFVGMMGPKGPGEELIIKKTQASTYSVNYMVKEPGTYMLIVRWGDEHIPGSPFCVECT